jgi:hypothetical protein
MELGHNRIGVPADPASAYSERVRAQVERAVAGLMLPGEDCLAAACNQRLLSTQADVCFAAAKHPCRHLQRCFSRCLLSV